MAGPTRRTSSVSGGEVAAALPVRIAEGSLRLEERLCGKGGQANLFHCTGPDGEHYVYKKYNERTLPSLDTASLVTTVEWRRRLPADEKRDLDHRCAWPLTLVEARSGVVGILVRPAGAEMYEQSFDALTQGRVDNVRDVGELLRSPQKALRVGRTYYEPPRKLAVLGKLLESMLWMHDRGHVLGDLHFANVLFTVSPHPEVFLVDCDSFVPLDGEPVLVKQVSSVVFPLPASHANERFGVETDYAKFARIVALCLQETAQIAEPDQNILRRVMSKQFSDVFTACFSMAPPANSRVMLDEMAALWPCLLLPDRMFVELEPGGRFPWPDGRSALDITTSPPDAVTASLVPEKLLLPAPGPPVPGATAPRHLVQIPVTYVLGGLLLMVLLFGYLVFSVVDR